MRTKLHTLMRGEVPKRLTCYTGAEPAYLPLLLSAAGAAASYEANSDAADRKQQLVNAMGQYKLGNANKQVGVVQNFIAKDTPEAKAQANLDGTSAAQTNYDTTVGAAQAFTNPGQVSGDVSQQFKDSGQASADAASARNNKLIANLSTMRGVGLAQQQRARDYGKAAGDVSALSTASGDVGSAYGTDINGVVPDPAMGLVSGVATGVGGGLAAANGNKKLLDALANMRVRPGTPGDPYAEVSGWGNA